MGDRRLFNGDVFLERLTGEVSLDGLISAVPHTSPATRRPRLEIPPPPRAAAASAYQPHSSLSLAPPQLLTQNQRAGSATVRGNQGSTDEHQTALEALYLKRDPSR